MIDSNIKERVIKGNPTGSFIQGQHIIDGDLGVRVVVAFANALC